MDLDNFLFEAISEKIKTGLCKVRIRTADADGGWRTADGGRRTADGGWQKKNSINKIKK